MGIKKQKMCANFVTLKQYIKKKVKKNKKSFKKCVDNGEEMAYKPLCRRDEVSLKRRAERWVIKKK